MKLSQCNDCFLRKSASAPVPGEGSKDAKLILIGECPGREEDVAGRPFVGEAGRLLTHILKKMGLKRSDVYLTNILKCHPKNNELPSGDALDACIEACAFWLCDEVEWRKKITVLLGAIPLYARTEKLLISKYEGRRYNIILWVSYHPAFVLRRPTMELNVYRVIYRAAKQAGLPVKRRGWEVEMFPYKPKKSR